MRGAAASSGRRRVDIVKGDGGQMSKCRRREPIEAACVSGVGFLIELLMVNMQGSSKWCLSGPSMPRPLRDPEQRWTETHRSDLFSATPYNKTT